MIRFSDLAQHQRNLNTISTTQARIQELQTQISSGQKAQYFQGLGRDIGRLLDLEETHTQMTQYRDNIAVANGRLEAMELNVAQVYEVMSEFKTLMVNALNADNANDLNLPAAVGNMLDQVVVLLNADFNGRYLFGGSRTNVAPVDPAGLPAFYGAAPGNLPTADGDALAQKPPLPALAVYPNGYYQGDNVDLGIRVDDSKIMTYGIRANEPGFERAIRALDMVTRLPGGIVAPDTMQDWLNHALDVANTAIDDIVNLRTEIGTTQSAMERIDQKHNDFLLFAERTFSEIQEVDIPAAMTELSTAQVTLEASFAAITRLSQTSLLNFLR